MAGCSVLMTVQIPCHGPLDIVGFDELCVLDHPDRDLVLGDLLDGGL